MKAAAANKPSHLKPAVPAPGTGATNAQDDESDDDEEGRTASIGQKKRKATSQKVKSVAEPEQKDAQEGEQGGAPSMTKDVPVRQAPSKGKKKATSYLDELLAERAKKRKKRWARRDLI